MSIIFLNHTSHICSSYPWQREELRLHMDKLINYLRGTVPALFESEEYRAKEKTIQKAFSEQQEQALMELRADAEKQEVALLHTPDGFAFSRLVAMKLSLQTNMTNCRKKKENELKLP